MRQVVLERPGRLVPGDATPPAAGAGEALVRVRRVGVCGTDFHAFHGRQPFFTGPPQNLWVNGAILRVGRGVF